MLNNPINNSLLTADELAKYLKVKTSWVRWATHKRIIPSLKIGKYARYHLDNVVKSLQERIPKEVLHYE